MEWIEARTLKPIEGRHVMTKLANPDRNEQMLVYSRGLWWFTDMSMYVYYTPTHWRYVH